MIVEIFLKIFLSMLSELAVLFFFGFLMFLGNLDGELIDPMFQKFLLLSYFFVGFWVMPGIKSSRNIRKYIMAGVYILLAHYLINFITSSPVDLQEVLFSSGYVTFGFFGLYFRENLYLRNKAASAFVLLIVSISFVLGVVLHDRNVIKTEKSLVDFVKQGSHFNVKKLIEKGDNINQTDDSEATPLMWAAFNGDVKMIKYLVSKGADCKKQGIISIDNNKRMYGSPINAAVGEGHLDAVKVLFEKCHLNINEKMGKINRFLVFPDEIVSPQVFYSFLKTTNDEITKQFKFEIGKVEDKFLSLAISGYINRIVVGQDLSIVIKTTEKSIKNPFLRMINNRKIIDNLYGSFINKKKNYDIFDKDNFGGTVLIEASEKGYENIVEYLLDLNAAVNIEDSDGISPLFAAVVSQNYKIAEKLLSKGAKATSIAKDFDSSVIDALFMIPSKEIENKKEILKNMTSKLVLAGAEINYKNIWGETILYKMCKGKNDELVEFLISLGADPEIEVDGKKIRDFCKEHGVEIKDEWFKKK